MNWQEKVKKESAKSLKKRRVNQPPRNISVQLKLEQFKPVSGWYKSDIQVSFKIRNAGNWPSHNTVVAIYAGKTGKEYSEFVFVGSTKTSIYPGQTVVSPSQFSIQNKKLPFSSPVFPLPGSSKPILIAVCFDPFLCPANLHRIDESTIRDNDNLAGGFYINSAINRVTGKVIFGYTDIS